MEKQGARNSYRCEKCQGTIVTVNLADGVTPFMVKCRAHWPDTSCDGMAQSGFYRIDQSTPPGWGWHRPGEAELSNLAEDVREHVQRGGLLLRKLDGAERETYGGSRLRHG